MARAAASASWEPRRRSPQDSPLDLHFRPPADAARGDDSADGLSEPHKQQFDEEAPHEDEEALHDTEDEDEEARRARAPTGMNWRSELPFNR